MTLCLHSCLEVQTDKADAKEYATEDFLGTWQAVNADDTYPKLQTVALLNDSVAKITLKDSTGERQISRRWTKQGEEYFGPIDFKYDFKLSYRLGHTYVLMGTIEETDNKLTISVNDVILEKQPE